VRAPRVQGERSTLYLSPDSAKADRPRLESRLTAIYHLVTGGGESGPSGDGPLSLSLPVMGLDEIIGIIRTEPEGTPYDARHLRLLSVIAAQLGSYLSMAQLRERDKTRSRELEVAHDFQRLLAGVVGHDLRNPLAVIQAVASSLLESTTDERQVRALQRALRNVEHATSLITDLVDVTESRVTGVIRVFPKDEDLYEIVEGTVEDLRHAHPTRSIQFSASSSQLVGPCEALRVAQIVTNLVNNAMIHGAPERPVDVALVADSTSFELSVRNFGPVIAADILPTIFDPFKQGAPTSRPHSVRGLGLGLYIVDCLARGHGGTVHVASSAEQGTLFTVRLPRNDTSRRPHAAASTRLSLVMIVDDDADVRDAISPLLRKRGYETAEAVNGKDALEQLRAGLRPQLILLDLQMPVMDGHAFAEVCAEDPELASIPIVVVSSDTASAVKLAATRARGYLSKPVSFERLLAAIENVH
jgi:signal transduction histidine kinase